MKLKNSYLLLVATSIQLNGCNPSLSQDTLMLFEAARDGDVNMLEELVDRGANVNATDDDGNTPLHYTSDVTEERLESMDELDASVIGGGVAVALSVARFDGYNRGTTLLIEKGANLNARNNDGDTPLALARRANHRGVIQILEAHGAQE